MLSLLLTSARHSASLLLCTQCEARSWDLSRLRVRRSMARNSRCTSKTSMAARMGKESTGSAMRSFGDTPLAKCDRPRAIPRPRVSATTCWACDFAVMSAMLSERENFLWKAGWVASAIERPTLLPTFPSEASSKKFLGQKGVSISRPQEMSHTTVERRRNFFSSRSYWLPSFATIPSLPSFPMPSFSSQLKAAAVGRLRFAPTPTARSMHSVE
mmetsp:Transcript_41017/g.87204  ORF Transcript_41017/g.87204 Transcript_41017/m.87204 type:complete len:214 (-) Transcript_41017:260-901(-)